MIGIARHSIRARWTGFAATFLALALGVAVMSGMGSVLASSLDAPEPAPERYAAAPVVVQARHTVQVSTPAGPATLTRTDQPGLPPEVVARIGQVATVTEDRSFYAQVAGHAGDSLAPALGHPWPSAAFTPYRLEAGRAPAADSEIVVDSRTGLAPGARATVLTAAGARPYTVAGVVPGAEFETPVFFTAAEAARISPRVDAIVAEGPVEAVRGAAGEQAEVLTGDERVRAEPNADRRSDALLGVTSMTSTSIGLAVFVVVFVVASTFAFAVAQRRREFGLLRVVGATPRQVRRMVYAESLLVSSLASAAGCALGAVGGPLLADALAGSGLAPPWFGITGWAVLPMIASFLLGVGVSLLAVVAASRTAAGVRPVEALRESAVDSTVMTRGRWWLGGGCLGFGVVLVLVVIAIDPWVATVPLLYAPIVMLPVVGIALLAPVVVKPLARLVTWPLGWFRGAVGMVARENTLTAVRRTATTAAPVLLAVGMSLSVLGATHTITQAQATGLGNQVSADYVVVPDGAPVLNEAALDRVRSVPGTRVATSRPTTVHLEYLGADAADPAARAEVGADLREARATAVDPGVAAEALTPALTAGSLADLDDRTVVLDEEIGRRVGERVDLWLADGRQVTLRVAAVLRSGVLDEEVLLSSRYAGPAPADAAYVLAPPGAGERVLPALRAATGGLGASALTVDEWIGGLDTDVSDSIWLGLVMTLGIVVLYSAMSIVSTLVMSTADRRGVFASLRLAGATSGQVLRVVVAEAAVVVAVGVLLAVLVSLLNLAGLRMALGTLVGGTPIVLPWGTGLAITAGCVVLTVLASVITARLGMRRDALRAV